MSENLSAVFFINLHTHTHLHKGGKGVTIPSKLVTEADHCLKQSTLPCSTKIQNKRNQYWMAVRAHKLKIRQ